MAKSHAIGTTPQREFALKALSFFAPARVAKFIFDESAFMRFTALTLPDALRRLVASLERSDSRTGTGGYPQCLTSASIVHCIVQLS
jgi:hypothetical protein